MTRRKSMVNVQYVSAKAVELKHTITLGHDSLEEIERAVKVIYLQGVIDGMQRAMEVYAQPTSSLLPKTKVKVEKEN